MSVTPAVKTRWGLMQHEELILVPLKTLPLFEKIKAVVLTILTLITFGATVYLNPSLFDQLYYQVFYHQKLVKILSPPKDPVNLMTLGPLSNAFPSASEKRIKKIAHFFLLAQRQMLIRSLSPPSKAILFQSGVCGSNGPYTYTSSVAMGAKSPMEDLLLIDSRQILIKAIKAPLYSFILMDGHGINPKHQPINEFTKTNFLKYLERYLNGFFKEGFNLDSLYSAFKKSFVEINQNYPFITSGTTFIGVFIVEKTLIAVSIGDSSAYLVNQKGPLSLALRASLLHPYFKAKLDKRKVVIHLCKNVHRVGGLNMATSLGDKAITGIKPNMSFIAMPLEWIQRPAQLMLGSDGVFDHISETELANLASQGVENLLQTAFSRGSQDNLSALIINL